MTKLIAVLIVVAVLWGGWLLFLQWERVKNDEQDQKKQAAAAAVIGDSLPGVPWQLDQSLRAAQAKGPETLKAWLKTYNYTIQDPRKAWLELDYCLAIAGKDPSEARRVFAEVKARTPENSPVWPRIKQLEKSYQ